MPAVVQHYRERLPVAALAPYVTCVWVQHVAAESAPYTHRTVPNGSAELVCPLGAAMRIVGPQTGPTAETLAPGTSTVGVRFRPGVAPAVFGVSAADIVDLSIAAETLWGSPAVALSEQLEAVASPQQAAHVLERELLRRIDRRAGAPDPIAAEAVRRLRPWSEGDVGSLPAALSISERQLRRRFEIAVGVAPKVLQRMLRFQGFLALTYTDGGANPGLARLAADAGYADQAHLTRESVRLAGRPPAVVLSEAERDCRPGHDHAASYLPLLAPHPTI